MMVLLVSPTFLPSLGIRGQAPQGRGQRQAPVSWASSEGHTQHLRPKGDKRGHLGLNHTLGHGSGHPVPAGELTLGEEGRTSWC